MCKMNKCSKPDCSNVVSDNRFTLCQDCHRKERRAAEYHVCETPDCTAMVPNRFRFCFKCCQAFKAEQQKRADAAAKLRELQTKQQAEATFRTSLIAGIQKSLSDSRVQSGLEVMHFSKGHDADRNRSVLFSCMEEYLPKGAKIKSMNGSQVIVMVGLDKSHTVYSDVLGRLMKEISQEIEESRRRKEAETARKAEEARRVQKETERELFVRYTKGELSIVHEERQDTRITVLLESGQTFSFDDLDEIETRAQKARDAKAAADAKIRADRKANEKKGGKKDKGQKGGKEQRKAA